MLVDLNLWDFTVLVSLVVVATNRAVLFVQLLVPLDLWLDLIFVLLSLVAAAILISVFSIFSSIASCKLLF
jgi:hypothetical protein